MRRVSNTYNITRRNNLVYITMLEQYLRSFKTIVMFVSESFVLFMQVVFCVLHIFKGAQVAQ
jgi:hypothetical protein